MAKEKRFCESCGAVPGPNDQECPVCEGVIINAVDKAALEKADSKVVKGGTKKK